MALIDLYILRVLRKPLIYGLALFSGVLIIPELFRRLSQFIEAKVSLWIMIKYFIYKLPLTISLISPVAVLLACLFSLGNLAHRHEITAFKACGVSLYRLSLPILCLGLFLSFTIFLWDETIVPIANQKMEWIKQIEIQKKSPRQMKANDPFFRSRQGWFVNAKTFDGEAGVLAGVELKTCYPDGEVLIRIDAQDGKWMDNGWELREGIERRFDRQGGIIIEQRFKKKRLTYLQESPDQIWALIQTEGIDSNSMSIKELWAYIQLLKGSGLRTEERLVDFYLKMSLPLANLIMALIGTAMAVQRPGGGRAASFGLSILISFLYWQSLGVGRALGYAGHLPPFLAAWSSNLIFGLAGGYLTVRARK